jgi:uncharacterized protein YxeA
MLFLFFFILTAGLITSHAQTIQGTVYRDFNANGTKTNTSSFNEIGVKNVLVIAYKKDGTWADSTRTAADGTYSLANAPNSDGDLEVLCAPQPIEIGNRLWKDTDKDGIQDANEIGIDGVTVTLCDSTGAVITTVVTGNGGQYYFTSASTPGSAPYVKAQIDLKTNTKYILKIGNFATQAILLACDPTTANTTTDNGLGFFYRWN